MDSMISSVKELSLTCLELFDICLNRQRPNRSDGEAESYDGKGSNVPDYYKKSIEYRLADFNLWIDGIGALAPSKASLDSRLRDKPIDLSLVKGNLTMLSQALQDYRGQIDRGLSVGESLLDIDSTLESLVALALAIRRTGRKSRLHKADRLFHPENHTELMRHLECIVILRPGMEGRESGHEYQRKIESLSPLQRRLIAANLRRRNRFIQAQLHSAGLKSRAPILGRPDARTHQQRVGEATVASTNYTPVSDTPSIALTSRPDNQLQSVTAVANAESSLDHNESPRHETVPSPMTAITKITASARYPKPRVESNQRLVQCPCCCQMLSASEVKNDKAWRKHLSEDIRPYTCIFNDCPTPNVYYSNRAMLERHFRQDHPPVWQCPICNDEQVFTTMTAMVDHLQGSHTFTTRVSDTLSSSIVMKMGIKSCPLCDVTGQPDSPALIDHVLEHVHDFSLRSLPWPKSADIELGGEVGTYNASGDGGVAVTSWLEGVQMLGDEARCSIQLSIYDRNRLSKVEQLIESQPHDTLGVGIYFAEEEGVESAEAEDGQTVVDSELSSVEEDDTTNQTQQNDQKSDAGQPGPKVRRSRTQRLVERVAMPWMSRSRPLDYVFERFQRGSMPVWPKRLPQGPDQLERLPQGPEQFKRLPQGPGQ